MFGLFQDTHEVMRNIAHDMLQRLEVKDRLGKSALCPEWWVLDKRDERLMLTPQHLIEPDQGIGFGGTTIAEAPDETFTRNFHQVANGFQPEPGQQQSGFRIEPQGSNRQSRKRFRQIVRHGDGRTILGIVGKRPGSSAIGRTGDTALITLPQKKRFDPRQHRTVATKQMCTARTIEQYAIVTVHHAPGAPALRCKRQLSQRALVAFVIEWNGHQFGCQHSRIGQAHAGLRTSSHGHPADGIDDGTMCRVAHQHDGLSQIVFLTLLRGNPAPPVDREGREPQGDYDPVHASPRHVRAKTARASGRVRETIRRARAAHRVPYCSSGAMPKAQR